MSHFNVAVFTHTDDPSELETLLAPFTEEVDANSPYAEFEEDADGELNPINGKHGYWFNPNAKHDYWLLGGRWRGQLKLKEGKNGRYGEDSWMRKGEPTDPNRCDCAKAQDCDFTPDEAVHTQAMRYVYDDFILSAECIIENTNRLPEINAWLRGSGPNVGFNKVTFANRQGGFYYARIVNQISFEKILRGNPHRSLAVNFRCQPFWYQENVQPITLTASTQFITNPGSVYSEPVITVYGSGDITLMVNSTIIELKDIDGSITLDTPLMEAYNGATSLNSKMTGDFPVLQSGSNAVSWKGSVTKVFVQPNWRFL